MSAPEMSRIWRTRSAGLRHRDVLRAGGEDRVHGDDELDRARDADDDGVLGPAPASMSSRARTATRARIPGG